MMPPLKLLIASSIVIATAVTAAAPASAVVTTFATFSALNTARNLRFVNSGNSAARTSDATIYSIASNNGTTPGSVAVRFSFLQPVINTAVSNVSAMFTYTATVAKNTPATASGSQLRQSGIAGSFSFLSTSAITVGTTTYAAGANLLSGTFTGAELNGSGSSAGADASTLGGDTVVFSSDFLDFSGTVNRDSGLTLTAINPSLAIHTGANKALNSFRATVGGQFSSDPAPLVNAAVPEPASWMMMIAGFGMVGVSARRRRPVSAAA